MEAEGLFPSLGLGFPLSHRERELPCFLHQDVMRSKEAICMIGLLRHSTQSEDSPDAVLAFEGSRSVRETQGRAWPCDQAIIQEILSHVWLWLH